jgi:hypothetical protein
MGTIVTDAGRTRASALNPQREANFAPPTSGPG